MAVENRNNFDLILK